jgi:hypothetical protein
VIDALLEWSIDVELKRVWVAGRGCRECDGDGLIGLRAAKKAKLLELKSTREEYIYIYCEYTAKEKNR